MKGETVSTGSSAGVLAIVPAVGLPLTHIGIRVDLVACVNIESARQNDKTFLEPTQRIPMAGGRQTKWRLLKLLPGFLVAAACLWYAFRNVDWPTVAERLESANWLLAPLMGLLLFVFYTLKAWRWKLLLEPVAPMRVRDVAGPLMIGFMANNILPAHLGELVRVHVLGRTRNVPRAAVLSTVILERLFDLLAILVVFGVGLHCGRPLPEEYQTAAITLAVLTGLLLAGAVAFVFASEPCLKLLDWICNTCLVFLPTRWRSKLVELLRSAADGLEALKQPRLAAGIVTASVAKWFVMGLMVWMSLKTLGATDVFAPALVVVGVIAVVILLPAPPGYVGIIQGCFTAVLALYDVDPSLTVAASVYYHLWQYVPVTLVGLYCLQRTGLRLSDVTHTAPN